MYIYAHIYIFQILYNHLIETYNAKSFSINNKIKLLLRIYNSNTTIREIIDFWKIFRNFNITTDICFGREIKIILRFQLEKETNYLLRFWKPFTICLYIKKYIKHKSCIKNKNVEKWHFLWLIPKCKAMMTMKFWLWNFDKDILKVKNM